MSIGRTLVWVVDTQVDAAFWLMRALACRSLTEQQGEYRGWVKAKLGDGAGRGASAVSGHAGVRAAPGLVSVYRLSVRGGEGRGRGGRRTSGFGGAAVWVPLPRSLIGYQGRSASWQDW